MNISNKANIFPAINNHNSLKIGEPLPHQLPQLRSLWKEAFGDDDAFLDTFYDTAFSLHRCRCITIEEKVVAVLYWFDCTFHEKPLAYIYAVATAKAYQGQGLCHVLMEQTHKYLADTGYIGAILVPANQTLFQFYENIGYKTCCYINEIFYDTEEFSNDILSVKNEITQNTLHQLTKKEFSHLRRQFLSKNAILQENENLDFLETQAQFYFGENFLLTASKHENVLYGLELLGDTSAIPQILEALECTKGRFRIPTIGVQQHKKAFAMYLPLNENIEMPDYFGFAFD